MAQLQRHHIKAVTLGTSTVLAALNTGDGQAHLFFTKGSQLSPIMAENFLTGAEIRSVGDAPWLTGPRPADKIQTFVDSKLVEIPLEQPQLDMMSGRNVALATRNGETAETVLQWLAYHAKHQGMTGAVILDRAKPDTDEAFVKALSKGLKKLKDMAVVLVDCDVPLGLPDTAPEHHPYVTPGAPGKDRMDVPQADPWNAPLGDVLIYEMLRHLFLSKARAVANIEIYDLVPADPRGTMFDLAQDAKSGVVQLVGQQCYPWRVREDDPVQFADHISVQFDAKKRRGRWCAAMSVLPDQAVFRLVRIGGVEPAVSYPFYRFMALRHRAPSVSKIVPKASLIEHAPLLKMAKREWKHQPVLMPQEDITKPPKGDNSVAIVTCMKNEGPFILEWLAYHRAIGIEGFLVYTNDCTDGTDELLDLLQEKGYVQHRDNKFHGTGLKPQHHALQQAEKEPVIMESDWAISMDVDEFINIKVGDGTMTALFDTVPDANLISCTWRLFGNNDVHEYEDRFLVEQFFRAAPEFANKPHQAWGFKTLFKNVGLFKKLGVHRPKGLKPQVWDKIRWYNGSAKPMPEGEYRNAWRSNASTYGYDVVQLNHYAVRSAESFLVKRDRGRVNHVDRDQGLAYWFRMNNNFEEERSIQRMIPKLQKEFDRLMADPDIRAMHDACVAAHKNKIAELRATENYSNFYAELTGARMEKLSRMHRHFGANVFLSGPECVPDEVLEKDVDEEFFFTVERGETAH
ncbi:glycosyltransferase family 2 protein [Celeribacter halophilus]|uniref:glycosyltransferase family 2 protein n=1 Tax=Celeribacter halophilus TaxID=576117 RepID=UPI0026E3CF48|nr:glycosyltransferase family 2 protein [Celeribacter halophilus]MDO6724749.1 glycosyltransferase family 2 protein [Celeribacter halophilus]